MSATRTLTVVWTPLETAEKPRYGVNSHRIIIHMQSENENILPPTTVRKQTARTTNSLHDTRYTLAKDPFTPPSVLDHLAQDKRWEIRALVASHQNTKQETLTKLAQDRHSTVRGAVATNPTTTHALLFRLAQDRNGYVRLAVALNPSLSVTKAVDLLDRATIAARYATAPSRYAKDMEQAVAVVPNGGSEASVYATS